MTADISIFIALHKPYWFPDDPMYVPVQVGAGEDLQLPRVARDSTGDSISELNPKYSELTAQYWAWKNTESNYAGLAHYRRHFSGSGPRGVLSHEDAAAAFRKAPVVLPRLRHYFIETLSSHYTHTFDSTDLTALRDAVYDSGEAYGTGLEKHLARRSGHMFNMHIMRRDIFDAYCSWLYPVLEAVDSRIDYSTKTPFEARCVGRVSEFLLDVWLNANQVPYVEQPVISLERVNWPKKGMSFLAAKFLGKGYKKSF